MSAGALCRVCLASNVWLYEVIGTPLQEIIEKLLLLKLTPEDGKPILICYICNRILRKCHDLVMKARRAEELLTYLLESGVTITTDTITVTDRSAYKLTYGLSLTPIDHLSLTGSDTDNLDIVIKDEVDKDKEKEKDNKGSDSEDDVPLKIFKNKIQEKTLCKVKKKKISTEKGKKDDVFSFAREIILTKAEQLQELQQRAQSQNYLGSPLKCHLCYKGFTDMKAFDNHKQKHDVSSGPSECPICHLRYQSDRHMRSHVAQSHGRKYECMQCSHRSLSTNQAKAHQRWHNGHIYHCKLCEQTFRKPTSYFSHMRKRHPSEHVCDICGQSFIGQHGLMTHKTKSHKHALKENPNEPQTERFCTECEVQFATREAWKRHILMSSNHAITSDSSPICKICEAKFSSLAVLSRHLKSHRRELKTQSEVPAELRGPVMKCDQCDAHFVTPWSLKAHVSTVHLGVKYNRNIVCEICGKKCTSNATLIYHQRTHTGEKPFECDVCSKKFTDKNQLRVHTRRHTGERPYCCMQCGKRFRQKPALNKHHRMHLRAKPRPTEEKPYICQYCSKTYSQSNSLKHHVRSVHFRLPNNRKRTESPMTDCSITIQSFRVGQAHSVV